MIMNSYTLGESEGPTDPEDPSEPELPETGIALGTSVATTSLVLLALGGLVMFFTRRRFQQ